MTSGTYTRYELVRAFRNRRFFVFSIGFPVVMYFLLAGPNDSAKFTAMTGGITAPLFYMVGLLSFGGMIAALGSGARIATERSVGWNRHLRLTPLTPRQYFRTKVLTGYLMVLSSMALLYLAGISLGVRLPLADWLEMTVLV